MNDFDDYCMVCTTDLIEGLDCDPNGDMKSLCLRCEAMEEIDFDVYPNAFVFRDGRVDYNDECKTIPNLYKKTAI